AAFDDLRREQLRGSALQNELRFHQLDVSDLESIGTFIEYIVLMHGSQAIDILVNNAGGVVKSQSQACSGSTSADAAARCTTVRTCDYDTAYKSVHMNYFTAVNMTTLALPHMRPHGRVLFMVTALAHLGIFSGDLPKVLASDDLDLTRLHIIENGFVSSVGKGSYSTYGFPPMPFAVSKAGLIAYARMLARTNSSSKDPRQLLFAAVCPGYVSTDMTGPYATLTPDQGAETPVYVALTDDKRISRHNGGLWKHFKPLKW
ncbi:V-type proton ATPase 21 kDa proteolipid subunit, partial [Coemansia sp. RSA 1933]